MSEHNGSGDGRTIASMHTGANDIGRPSGGARGAAPGALAGADPWGQLPMRRLRAGDVLFWRGDAADAMAVVVTGRLAARHVGSRGDTALTSVVGSGRVVAAYAAVGTREVHPYDTVALDESAVRIVRREQFAAAAARSPHVLQKVLQQVCGEADGLAQLVAEAFWERSDLRVRRRLAELAALYRDGSRAEIALTHDVLASIAGVTRPTVTTVLRDASRAGVARCTRARIVVDDVDRLRRWAS